MLYRCISTRPSPNLGSSHSESISRASSGGSIFLGFRGIGLSAIVLVLRLRRHRRPGREMRAPVPVRDRRLLLSGHLGGGGSRGIVGGVEVRLSVIVPAVDFHGRLEPAAVDPALNGARRDAAIALADLV